MIAVAMYRGRQAQRRRAHALGSECEGRRFRLARRMGRGNILLGGQGALPLQKQGSGGGDQRAVGSGESLAKRSDSALIFFGARRVIREIVDEGGVDHAVRCGSSAAQAFKILERTAVHFGARRFERLGGGSRARETEHLMARGEKLANDGGTDETRGPGNENQHLSIPPTLGLVVPLGFYRRKLTNDRQSAKTENFSASFDNRRLSPVILLHAAKAFPSPWPKAAHRCAAQPPAYPGSGEAGVCARRRKFEPG